MPREHAQVNMGIWQDEDFRALPPPAQHLYWTLWTHPGLSYCGVVDWRPARLTGLSDGWLLEDVRDAADCLRARHFIVTDDDTEECLIRSWVRWDGLLKQPRLAVSYANAYAAVSSRLLRQAVIYELVKLQEREPDLVGFTRPQVRQMLDLPSVSAKISVSVSDPFGDGFTHRFGPGLGETLPSVSGSVSGSVSVPPTPSPATTPLLRKDLPAQKRGQRLDPSWIPSEETRRTMAAQCPLVDLEAEHAKFVDHWTAKTGRDATKLDWDATWRNWIRNARPSRGDVRQRHTDDIFSTAAEWAADIDHQQKAIS